MRNILNLFRVAALWILVLPIGINTLGAASNQLVLYANHDTFPVSLNLVKAKEFASDDAAELPDGTLMIDDTHCLMTKGTHLNLLADIFDFHKDIESIGDLMIDFGNWLWTFAPFVWGAVVIGRLRNAFRPSDAQIQAG